MKTSEFLIEVANLIQEREIISHGTIRCLQSEQAVRDIESAEGCDEVDSGSVGDDELADKLRELADDGAAFLSADPSDMADKLNNLWSAHRGADIGDYLDGEKEDELRALDRLIDAAKEFSETVS